MTDNKPDGAKSAVAESKPIPESKPVAAKEAQKDTKKKVVREFKVQAIDRAKLEELVVSEGLLKKLERLQLKQNYTQNAKMVASGVYQYRVDENQDWNSFLAQFLSIVHA